MIEELKKRSFHFFIKKTIKIFLVLVLLLALTINYFNFNSFNDDIGGVILFVSLCIGTFIYLIVTIVKYLSGKNLQCLELYNEKDLENNFSQGKDFKKIIVCENYLIFFEGFELNIIHFSNIDVLYKRTTHNRVNFIPVGNDYELIILLKSEKEYKIQLPKRKVEEIINYVDYYCNNYQVVPINY